MADLAPPGGAHRARLTDRVRREVVVVHVALVGDVEDPVQALRVRERAQRRGGEDLRLAAGEHARAVHARHVVDLAPDRPDLIGLAAVGANLLVDDHGAELVLFHGLDDLVEVLGLGILEQRADVRVVLLRELGQRGFAREVGERRVALLLVGDAHRLGDFLLEVLARPLVELLVERQERVLALALADLARQLVDRGDDLLDLFVREGDRVEEHVLGDLLRAALDHHHRVGGAGDDDFHPARLVLLEGRVDDEAARFVAPDAHGGDVGGEGNVAHRERRARGADRDDVAVEARVGGEDGRDDLDVIAETVGEQGPDRAIHLAGAQHAVLGRPAFPLDVAAGDLARRVHLLFVFAGEGEEVDSLTGLLRRRRGAEDDDLIAVAYESGPVGLLRKLPRLNDERTATDLERDGFWHWYS